MKAFLKIERCGEVFSVRSEKAEHGGDAGRGGRGGHPCRRHHLRRAALPDARPQRADLPGHHAGELRQAGKRGKLI